MVKALKKLGVTSYGDVENGAVVLSNEAGRFPLEQLQKEYER